MNDALSELPHWTVEEWREVARELAAGRTSRLHLVAGIEIQEGVPEGIAEGPVEHRAFLASRMREVALGRAELDGKDVKRMEANILQAFGVTAEDAKRVRRRAAWKAGEDQSLHTRCNEALVGIGWPAYPKRD